MTNEEINRVIAEFRGWVMYHPTPESVSKGYPSYSYWTPPRDSKQFAENWGKLELDYPPDYCNDFNAMHEAKETLNFHQQTDYVRNLMIQHKEFPMTNAFFATARQCAEAFLRTIGKWKG